jgi:hypothetical protein
MQSFITNLLVVVCAWKKGYKLTRQGKSIFKIGWRQVTSQTEGPIMSSDMTNTDTDTPKNYGTSSTSPEHLLFAREVGSIPFSFFLLKILIFHLYVAYYLIPSDELHPFL